MEYSQSHEPYTWMRNATYSEGISSCQLIGRKVDEGAEGRDSTPRGIVQSRVSAESQQARAETESVVVIASFFGHASTESLSGVRSVECCNQVLIHHAAPDDAAHRFAKP